MNISQLTTGRVGHHSTETSILHTLDNILHADSGKSLDLSAVSDTIDHNILLSRLHTSFRISDLTL